MCIISRKIVSVSQEESCVVRLWRGWISLFLALAHYSLIYRCLCMCVFFFVCIRTVEYQANRERERVSEDKGSDLCSFHYVIWNSEEEREGYLHTLIRDLHKFYDMNIFVECLTTALHHIYPSVSLQHVRVYVCVVCHVCIRCKRNDWVFVHDNKSNSAQALASLCCRILTWAIAMATTAIPNDSPKMPSINGAFRYTIIAFCLITY